ncbi:unnamed protein product, partial [Symbiodinium necroappetens]
MTSASVCVASGMEGCIVENAIPPGERLTVSRCADEKLGSRRCRELKHAVSPRVLCYVLCVRVPKSTADCYLCAEVGWGKLGSSHEGAQLPGTRLRIKVREQHCKAVGQAKTTASIMAVIGESCASLTPYGVGATLAQLGRGGLPNDRKPRRPVCIYGLGLTSAFERPATGQSRPSSPGPRLTTSRSAASVRSGSDSSRPPSSLSRTQLH